MTFIEFISGLESEYGCGKYSPLQMELIGKFLSDGRIDYVTAAEKILGYHSKSFKSLPDYAMFKKAFESEMKARLEEEGARAYAMLERKSYRYASLAVKGSRLITALDRIGGWMYFCDRTVEESPFMKERFIKAYIQASDGDEVKKYSGDLGTADANIICIGCSRSEFAMLESKSNRGLLEALSVKFSPEDKEIMAAQAQNERGTI